jgi:hypothetical protein
MITIGGGWPAWDQRSLERRPCLDEGRRLVAEELDQALVPAEASGDQVPVESADARRGDRQIQQSATGHQ